ncbi:MAG: minor capsid protein [Haemophilus haemolyticus]|nr:minor capsid protein [Haemophilus haemolyticus]DAJ34688.1 MAG TPA: minor capsid protein [Caudoviricetes sp.]
MVTSANKTPDELLESLLADRKILLFRYDAHLRREIYKKLTALQKQLINKISVVGVEGVNQRELNRLLKEVKELVTETYNNISDYSSSELNALLPIETVATYKIYNAAFKFDLFSPVPEYKIKAIKSTVIVAGSPLNDWWAKQGADVTFKFSSMIRQGMLDGKQTSLLITETKELLQISRRHAETLVRTAVMKVHDKAQEVLRDANADIIKGEQHISTLDLRTSDICRARDGKLWNLDKKPIGHNLPYQRPPLHPNCRSTLRLVTKSWRELGLDADDVPESTRASMDGQVKDNLNYEDWLKSKTTEQQDEVLGKGKADLWRKGIITFRDMIDQSGRPLTLKELKELYE